MRYRISGKRASQYTKEDWGKVIDSTWGPGQTAAAQLNVFDTFWSTIDKQWAGFPNLALNWDSMRTVYRPQIGTGLSRGRFYALMSRMSMALLEQHTFITDDTVESVFGSSTLQYRSGVPLLIIGTGSLDLLGAAVTPMPDSSGLVYRVAPGNPLGLAPGDIVLGYEGIPWKQLYKQLIDNGVPVSRSWSSPGTTPESRIHDVLCAVGSNWGMFDTIDIVKYSTGDTLHLPTSRLAGYTPSLWATDQVSIAGVLLPEGSDGNSKAVSWGVIQGTNIGYVYAWDWWTPSTPQLFHDAINDLRNNKKVDALVIDFRMNWGGDPANAGGGLSQLFSVDPGFSMTLATRKAVDDHMSFSFGPDPIPLGSTTYAFDRPIAVLIGPACLSAGDFVSFFMRSHPMVRFFGKPTNGAFVGSTWASGTMTGGWEYQIPTSYDYSNVFGGGYLAHKGVQPDEEVWLTRAGVAKGEDDVVKHALNWIAGLSYAHNLKIPSYLRVNVDTVKVTALVENPQKHSLSVWAIITDSKGMVTDSIAMADDGKHNDGLASDGTWGAFAKPRTSSDRFFVTIQTNDITQGTYRRTPSTAASFGAMFDRGILVVNGVSWTSYGSEISSACLDKAFFGSYQVTFWDCSGTVPSGGYPSTLPAPIGTGPIPADVLGRFSTVIWLGNNYPLYPVEADLTSWLGTPIPSYLEAGGNVILLARMGSSFLNWSLSNYLGITWAETNTTINATTPMYAGLTALRLLGAQSTDDVFQTSLTNGECTLLFTATGSFSGTRGMGVWRKPASGGALKSSGGNFVFISGRNYRWNHADLLANMQFFLNKFMGEQTTGVELASGAPLIYNLSQNYPNPFNPTTAISYQLTAKSFVTLKVYDILGRQISTLVNEVRAPGSHIVRFDASTLSSGVYFYKLEAGDFTQTRKMVLIR
ncbi:MAG TPA: S41 family peptidase [Bacteroidota bacterium]|nr:S41 family peptidase [Bacteroidota bacterium]